jgi:alkanesulfonate monooxygenase SsuD/methylene tetrahydromethanopterin reductase-like flavin-dependent oxidoreductase (luciferase family)
MVFDFFGFRKKPVIEDVEVKPLPPKSVPITFDEALAAQEAAKAVVPVVPIVEAPPPPPPPPPPVVAAEPPSSLELLGQLDAIQATAVPEAPTEVLGQMATLKATREDVIAAYKIFLGRLPESMEVVEPRVGVAPSALLVDFLASKEFLDQAPKAQLVLAVAKKILDERKQAAAAEGTSPA